MTITEEQERLPQRGTQIMHSVGDRQKPVSSRPYCAVSGSGQP